jgi:threonylcarbamoyladenosine tRNA methylthiotransferase MtaB
MKKLSPGALIAVCGCLSQLEASTASKLGADLVGGSGARREFALEIEKMYQSGKKAQTILVADDMPENRDFEDLPPGSVAGRTRALLKIQDGCDNRCAYCVIPLARGRARSLPIARAAEHARRLTEQGFREIVITGIEISSYGKDLADKPSLIDVVRAIGDVSPGVRLRLGSLDPRVVSEDFCVGLQAVPNLCGHFHISLQSGCDGTLRRMGRKYDTSVAYEAILELRRRFPDCGITADLITGFPGETDEEFSRTMDFITSAAFSGMHVFPYSPRPGTNAANMPHQVEKSVRQERAKIAAQAAAKMAIDFERSLVGKTVEVLFERELDGVFFGHSGNYVEVAVRDGAARNSVHAVQIIAVDDGFVWGDVACQAHEKMIR